MPFFAAGRLVSLVQPLPARERPFRQPPAFLAESAMGDAPLLIRLAVFLCATEVSMPATRLCGRAMSFVATIFSVQTVSAVWFQLAMFWQRHPSLAKRAISLCCSRPFFFAAETRGFAGDILAGLCLAGAGLAATRDGLSSGKSGSATASAGFCFLGAGLVSTRAGLCFGNTVNGAALAGLCLAGAGLAATRDGFSSGKSGSATAGSCFLGVGLVSTRAALCSGNTGNGETLAGFCRAGAGLAATRDGIPSGKSGSATDSAGSCFLGAGLVSTRAGLCSGNAGNGETLAGFCLAGAGF